MQLRSFGVIWSHFGLGLCPYGLTYAKRFRNYFEAEFLAKIFSNFSNFSKKRLFLSKTDYPNDSELELEKLGFSPRKILVFSSPTS